MIILGINAHHADASAAIVVDGKLVAAAEEERFRRIKHWAGFPSVAIEYCLREAGVSLNGVDHIAVNRKPNAHMFQRAKFLFASRPSIGAIRRRLENRARPACPRQSLDRLRSATCQHEGHSQSEDQAPGVVSPLRPLRAA